MLGVPQSGFFGDNGGCACHGENAEPRKIRVQMTKRTTSASVQARCLVGPVEELPATVSGGLQGLAARHMPHGSIPTRRSPPSKICTLLTAAVLLRGQRSFFSRPKLCRSGLRKCRKTEERRMTSGNERYPTLNHLFGAEARNAASSVESRSGRVRLQRRVPTTVACDLPRRKRTRSF